MKHSRTPILLILSLVFVALAGVLPSLQPAAASAPVHSLALAAPAPFAKLIPANNKTDVPTTNAMLRWSASSADVTYQYCLRPSKSSCPKPKWIKVGTNTSVVLQGLTAGKTYFWQVRAVDSAGQIMEANNGTWWSFTTVQNPNLPGFFQKQAPADLSTDQPVNGLAITWGPSLGATSYQYCYDTLNDNLCNTAWTTSSGLTATLGALSYGTTYYWQVRAVNASGNVQADLGTWFLFQTVPALGGAFGKTDPKNQALEQPIDLTLTWGVSSAQGLTYDYCLSTTPCTATSTWTSVGTEQSKDIIGLQYETTYYWQVRAVNAGGTVYADTGAVWTFKTQIAPPAAFGKSSPGKGATDLLVSLDLTWGSSTGAFSYEYCIVADPATCTLSDWKSTGANTSAHVSGLAYNMTYNWQVRAVNATGVTEANSGEVWQFTTQIAPPDVFGKVSPANSSAQKVPATLNLQWSSSTGATGYSYCVDTANHLVGDAACPNWQSAGSSTESIALTLAYNQTYYWQVRADNSKGSKLADGGTWWSFTTMAPPPSEFTKTSPADKAIDQPLTPWLYWWTPSTLVETYEYSLCETKTCLSPTWKPIGKNAPIHITTPLNNNATWYWQVRATNTSGMVEANADTWWSFTTVKAPPIVSNQVFDTPEDTPLNRTLTTTNANYPLDFSLSGSQPPGDLIFHSNGSFTYTPVPDFNGVVTFQFIVSDGHNLPVGPKTATITVTPVNDPPAMVAIPDQVSERGKELAFYIQAADPDLPYGDYLTYDSVEALPYGATIDLESGLFHWLVPANQAGGILTFNVRVTDSSGLAATQPVKITINVVNNSPVLDAIPDQIGVRGKGLIFSAHATDPDLSSGDHLTYSIDETLPVGASINPATGLFQWVIPPNQKPGVSTFTVRVTDSQGLADTATVKITIPNFKLMLPLIRR